MKAYLQIIFFILLNVGAKAQQYYFVYVQTDNKQPFYVKLNEKILSSSGSGYVVIPKLTEGNYRLTVGFPKDQWPQQNIPLTVDKNDAGYLLKNFGEKGWGLYNIHTMKVSMNGTAASQTETPADADDVFTNALAGAANTSLTMDKKPDAPAVTAATEPAKTPAENVPTGIKKIRASNDAGGSTIVYADYTGKKADTISIFIPAEAYAQVIKEKPVITEMPKEAPAEVKKFEDNDLQRTQKEIKEAVVETKVNDTGNKPVVSFNSDCKATAGDEDFLKLRKKMAAQSGDDEMVKAAGKLLKLKCYSAEQIKNLSALFLNDAGKYKFFDAAYPRVYDTQNFAGLQSQLSDEYFISRFRSMIRN